MIQDVKELRSEFGREPLFELELFGDGEIPVSEAGVAQEILRRRAIAAPRGRNQNGVTDGVAAEGGEGSGKFRGKGFSSDSNCVGRG